MAKRKNDNTEQSDPVQGVEGGGVDARRRASAVAVKQLRKVHGDEVVQWMTSFHTSPRRIIPTGSLALDSALCVGGIVRGRIYEFFGPESGGKTTLALSTIREAQRLGGAAIFVDAEHALDMGLVLKMGIDPDRLVLVRGYTGEQNLDMAEALMATAEFDLCVIDSVAALQPSAEANLKSFDDNTMGLQPRLMSRMCREFTPLVSRTGTGLILINQIRANIGGYGKTETTSGGNAIRHHMSGRIRVTGGGVKSRAILNEKGDVIGHRAGFEVIKNKLGPPFRTAEADLIYGKGFSRSAELLDLGVQMGFIDQAGSWFSYEGEKLGQGREKAMVTLEENEVIRTAVELGVSKVLGIVSE